MLCYFPHSELHCPQTIERSSAERPRIRQIGPACILSEDRWWYRNAVPCKNAALHPCRTSGRLALTESTCFRRLAIRSSNKPKCQLHAVFGDERPLFCRRKFDHHGAHSVRATRKPKNEVEIPWTSTYVDSVPNVGQQPKISKAPKDVHVFLASEDPPGGRRVSGRRQSPASGTRLSIRYLQEFNAYRVPGLNGNHHMSKNASTQKRIGSVVNLC